MPQIGIEPDRFLFDIATLGILPSPVVIYSCEKEIHIVALYTHSIIIKGNTDKKQQDAIMIIAAKSEKSNTKW